MFYHYRLQATVVSIIDGIIDNYRLRTHGQQHFINKRQSTETIYESCYIIVRLVKQNSYPLKDWHFEHMQKTIVKFIFGLSELDSVSSWKKRQHKKYSGNIGYVRRSIQFDIKHGVTGEVITFLDKIRNDISFTDVRKSAGSGERLDNLQVQLIERPQYTW